ncbi:MAG: recombinase family protein, partial [Pseudonocardiaceae bacterium]
GGSLRPPWRRSCHSRTDGGRDGAMNHQPRPPGRRPAAPGPLQRWLYHLAANMAWDAWQHDQQAARREAIRAYNDELQTRSQRARDADVRAGWWAGPPPYGYRAITNRMLDHRRRWRTRCLLSVDNQRAPVVATIYDWYLDHGLGPAAITARLAASPERYPPPLDHARKQQRHWTQAVVTGILAPNRAYTGHVVWRRSRRGKPLPVAEWVWSTGPSHPALITATQFKAAYNRRHGTRRPRQPRVRP